MAGMRAGLNGARSGLFMEQIRIIQEMRDADRKFGRTGIHIRPRFGIWENVVGALSSGRDAETGQKKPGADFQKVLEAFLQVEEPYLHTAAAKNAWKPFGMPHRRLGPTLRHWRKTTGEADIAYYFRGRGELRCSLCIRAAQ